MNLVISIIIPIYNMEQHLGRCLDSILAQTYTNLDILLVNDGSADASADICNKYAEADHRIKVIHQTNAGVSAARNAGLDAARGDYLSFVDPDDWVEPNMYETVVHYIGAGDVDILRFNAYRKGEIINELPFRGEYSDERLDEEVMLPLIGSPTFGGMFILGVLWLHIYKREIVERNSIRFDEKLRRCEDRLFTLTAALHARKMVFVEAALYHYEVYESSLSNKYDPLRWQQELIYLDELKKEYSACKSPDFVEKANRRVQSEYLLRAVTSVNNEFFTNNDIGFVNKYLNTKSIINNPNVRSAIENTPREKSGLKGKLTLGMIEYKLPLLLSIFNTMIVYKNKILKNG